jgi:hypothetical protein
MRNAPKETQSTPEEEFHDFEVRKRKKILPDLFSLNTKTTKGSDRVRSTKFRNLQI